MNYKRLFLISLIAALSIGALIGISVFIFGGLGDLETKLLLTTISIGGFSLTGLGCAAHPSLTLMGIRIPKAGMVYSVIGFLIAVVMIWEIIDPDYTWQLWTAFIVLSVTCAHLSLFYLIKPKTVFIEKVRSATGVFIWLTALCLLLFVILEFESFDILYRVLGVFAILNVLGTIAVPLLNKIISVDSK